ncbi:MAG: hypothetical protein IH609_17315 [Dehalococcoidia bacterium]|nr:hypothetical protein [Dehalococcoidia bacterium]
MRIASSIASSRSAVYVDAEVQGMANDNGAGAQDSSEEYGEVTTRLSLDRSAIRRVQADEVDITKSAVGLASFDRGTIRQSSAGAVIGRSVAMDEVKTGILISPVVRGDVHTLLDMRSAVAIGFGMVLGKVFLAAIRGAVRRATG